MPRAAPFAARSIPASTPGSPRAKGKSRGHRAPALVFSSDRSVLARGHATSRVLGPEGPEEPRESGPSEPRCRSEPRRHSAPRQVQVPHQAVHHLALCQDRRPTAHQVASSWTCCPARSLVPLEPCGLCQSSACKSRTERQSVRRSLSRSPLARLASAPYSLPSEFSRAATSKPPPHPQAPIKGSEVFGGKPSRYNVIIRPFSFHGNTLITLCAAFLPAYFPSASSPSPALSAR